MKKETLFLSCLTILNSCSTEISDRAIVETLDNTTEITPLWNIPEEEIYTRAQVAPVLFSPPTEKTSNIDYLEDNDLVIGYKNQNIIRAYPLKVLEWHEVINDEINDISFAITYCPFTGAGKGWNRKLTAGLSAFRVTNLIYNNNLIAYDTATNSTWSQMLGESVGGPLIGEKNELITLFETNWKTWKNLYPDSEVVSFNTGFSVDYDKSPYGMYSEDEDLFFFPQTIDESLLFPKEKVHAIINGSAARVYRYSAFNSKNVIREFFGGRQYFVVGNKYFIISFIIEDDTNALQFEYVYEDSEVILKDNEGNEWNVFGEAISGPRKGKFLKTAPSFKGYWFSIPAFYDTQLAIDQ